MRENIIPPNPTTEEVVQVNQIYREYENGKSYISNLGLPEQIKKANDFYEGRHWSEPTKENEDLPRPVFNLTKFITDIQVSKIINNHLKFLYIADDDKQATDDVTAFADYMQKEIKQSKLNREAVFNGIKKGTFIYFYYWDSKAVGTRGNYEGGMRGKIISPDEFIVSDPTEKDIQKQKYIIISTYEDVVSVRELCDTKERKALIGDESGARDDLGTSSTPFSENNKVVKVYTKFFRINGEVYYQLATKDTIIHEPIPCNPNVIYKDVMEKIKKLKEEQQDLENQIDGRMLEEIYEDGAILSIPTKREEFDEEDNGYKFYYYPFVVGTFYERDKSIYGISSILDVMGVQRAINTLPAYAILNAELFASPKTVAKKDALNGQEITNKIGEVIVDHTPLGNQGIYTLPINPMTGETMNLSSQLIDLIRMVTSTTEIVTGDMIGKDISGVAIGLLQAQDQQSNSTPSDIFKTAQEEIGKIWEQYFFLYYSNKKYSVDLPKNQIEKMKAEGLSDAEIAMKKRKVFNGEEYRDKDFHIVVEAGTGTKFSEAQSISVLNMLLQSGLIDAQTYVEMLPQNVVPFREKFKEYILAREQSEAEQLKKLSAQQQSELEQLSAYTKEQEKAIKELVSNLDKSNKNIAALQSEYAKKITQVNDFIINMGKGNNNL